MLHSAGDRLVPVEFGRWVAEHIPDARYVEFEDDSHLPWYGKEVDRAIDEIRNLLLGSHTTRPDGDRVLATILFTDVLGSTEHLARTGDERWAALLERHDLVARKEVERFEGRCVKSTGDGLLATFDRPARALHAVSAMRSALTSLGLRIRAGVHTGEVELRGNDVVGLAVHIAARVMDQAGPDETLVSSTVKDLVAGSGIEFEDAGSHDLKGVSELWQLFRVRSPGNA